MYTLLIVDDEKLPRECLAREIPWDRYGITMTGTAKNGEEALEKTRVLQPDIILTDIRMPHMDGLALMHAVRNEQPQTEFIVISGFEEFQYVKEALNEGACGYLLKPIDPPELETVILKLVERLDDKSRYDKDEQRRLERFLRDVVYGTCPAEEFCNMHVRYEELCTHWFATLIVQLDGFGELFTGESTHTYADIVTHIKRLCGEGALLVEHNPQGMLIVVNASEKEGIKALWEKLSDRITRYFRTLTHGLQYIIGIGSPCHTVEQLGGTYLDVVRLTCLKYLYGSNHVFKAGDVYSPAKGRSAPLDEDARRLVACALHGGREQLNAITQEIFDRFKRDCITVADIQMLVGRVVNYILNQESFSAFAFVESYTDFNAYLSNLCMSDHPDAMRERLLDFLHRISHYMEKQQAPAAKNIVEQAKAYIVDNYSSPKLSLLEIAKSICFSPTYLSTVFSRHCGKGITSYLNEVRIIKACELLLTTDNKVTSIAKQVGFSNSTYFSTQFRKQTGFSPSEYRLQGKSGDCV